MLRSMIVYLGVALVWGTFAALGLAAEVPPRLIISDQFRLDHDTTWVPCASPQPGWEATRHDYPEYEAVEWQINLRDVANDTATLFVDVDSADFIAQFPAAHGVNLHWSEGSHSNPSDFRPYVETLKLNEPRVLESYGGRSSDGAMPYFNLATQGGGLVVAVGWAGDWRTSFTVKEDGAVHIKAGLKRSRFRLQPDELLKLPAVLIMAYQGDWLQGQNQFRQLMKHHFTPNNHQSMDLMPVAASVHGMIAFNDTTAANLTSLAADIAELDLPIDTFWLDAGWNAGGFPAMQGNPDPDPDRFPHGLTPVSQAVDAIGLRFLVWFEPERVMRGSWLEREHADWLLWPSDTPAALRYMEQDGFALLDLGNPDARAWAVESTSKYITDANISIYRLDCNLYPAYFWHTPEAADEVGLREIRYINGLYAFLDELASRHPQLIIDNCASGGRRLDFETLRRSVVLWRSDSTWGAPTFPRNVQAMTMGLSHWLPLHGLGSNATDEIALRSGMGACASFAIDFRNQDSVATLRRHLERYHTVRPLFAADFYPLTPWSDDPAAWLAFQFHDPQRGEGLVQAFRASTDEARPIKLRLRGLQPDQRFECFDWDQPGTVTIRSGAELITTGIELGSLEPTAQATVLHYRATPTTPP